MKAAFILSCLIVPSVQAQQRLSTDDILGLSLEELGQIKVSSVSKQDELLSDAAASIYVITRSAIRSSGATTIPEALRLAPNLHVARGDAGQYAISARGFNSALGNKLLVLLDGRTIYSPFFAGVFWVSQDVVIEDIQRIEVISGPGGSLWGSNAVNGVINIITSSSDETQGGLLTAHSGTTEQGAALRYGGAIGDNGHYRVYAKAMEVDNTERADGSPIPDGFDRLRAGFRADWNFDQSQFTLQGDTYDGTSEQQGPGETTFSGTNILARYTRQFSGDSELRVQSYYDRTIRDNQGAYKDDMEIYDLELQYAMPFMTNSRLLFGGGYREAKDETINDNPFILFLPEKKNLRWTNIFIHDDITLPANLKLTLGLKWEENVYTGTEFLPNARLAWQPAADALLWGQISRAVRAPARLDRDFYIPIVGINGGPNFESEISDVLELGWRAQPNSTFSYSLTGFYHDHDKQRSGEPDPNAPGFVVSNTIEGSTKGIEGWAHYQASSRWRLSGGFVSLNQDLRNKSGSLDPTGPSALGNDPDSTALLRSIYDFNDNHQVHVTARHVGELPEPQVSSHIAVDVRYGWQINDKLEVSANLYNLFDSSHTEFGDPATSSSYERAAFIKIIWTNQD